LALKKRAQDNAGRFGRDDRFRKGARESEERQPEGRRYVGEGEKQVPFFATLTPG